MNIQNVDIQQVVQYYRIGALGRNNLKRDSESQPRHSNCDSFDNRPSCLIVLKLFAVRIGEVIALFFKYLG
jgi:hypothetical protein